MAGLLNTISSFFTRKKSANGKPKQPLVESSGAATNSDPDQNTSQVSDDDFYRQLLPQTNTEKTLSLPQKLIVQVVEENLFDKDSRHKSVPHLPSIIPQLIRSLKDPTASSRDYTLIIRKDPSMSAGVLKLANSVYFNPTSNPISSIDIAVVKLGIEGLRSVLSAVVMRPMIQKKTPYFNEFGQRLWQHSMSSAICCELLAKSRGIDLYKAYLLGLSHNIGKITIFSEICQQMRALPSETKPDRSAFIPLLQKKSDLLSYEIARDWQLPDEIISALKQQASVASKQNMGPFSLLLTDGKNISKNYLAYRYGQQEKVSSTSLQRLGLPGNLFELLDGVT